MIVVFAQYIVFFVSLASQFFTNAYRYLVQILPVAVVAPRYFAGAIELGVISQSAGAFNHILSDLSIIVNQFEQLSTFSAGIERLSGFYESMREVDIGRNSTTPLLQLNSTSSYEPMPVNNSNGELFANSGQSQASLIGSRYGDIEIVKWNDGRSTVLSIDGMDLVTPDQKRVLIQDLNVLLSVGQNLLIVGNSGVGKSSLLRAIAGLWTTGNGTIGRPVDDEVYFLPQRPYCTIGSLKDQLLYPSLDIEQEEQMDDTGNKIVPRSHWLKQSLTDKDLLSILERVNLLDVAVRAGDGDPVKGLAAKLDWSNILSLGEQQRLAFGRLLVNKPKLVIMDESTSALDSASEARMYSILQEMGRKTVEGDSLSAPGLTYISVGHRPSLIAFHDKKLRLGGDKMAHELSDIEKSSIQIPSPRNL